MSNSNQRRGVREERRDQMKGRQWQRQCNSVHPSFQLVAEVSGTVAHPSMLAPVQSSAFSSLLPSTPTLGNIRGLAITVDSSSRRS